MERNFWQIIQSEEVSEHTRFVINSFIFHDNINLLRVVFLHDNNKTLKFTF